MSHQRAKKPWEKPSGSFTKNVAPAVGQALRPDEPGRFEEEQVPQPTRDPNCRPGDKLRRVAAFANAATCKTQPAPQAQPLPNKWSLRELIDLLSEEYE